MTWVRLDDQFPDHPKALAAGAEAMWLYVGGLCWSARHLTDGRIPSAAVPRLAVVKRPEALARKLVEVGLWEVDADDFLVHDYLEFQPSKAQVESQRASQRDRQRRSRERRGGGDGVSAPTPTRPDPTPLLDVVSDDDDSGLPGSSSSWSDHEVIIEAGRVAARCSTKPKRDFDDFANGCATNIRRERSHLIPDLRALGLSLHEAAALLAERDAAELIGLRSAFNPDEFDDDFVSASDVRLLGDTDVTQEVG